MTEKELWLAAERVMTPNQFTVFWLHHHESFSVNLIAQAHGVSPQAIRERLKKGTERLRVEKERLDMEAAA